MYLSTLKVVLDLYCKSIGMDINLYNSCLIPFFILDPLLQEVDSLFPFPLKVLEEGFKYLVSSLSRIVLNSLIGYGW